ncbi:MAG: hypothetical protein ACI3XH_04825 [Phascolarctobacterium sp.]
MKLLVKKFSLRYDGKVYHAGQVVEMAPEEALALAKAAPLEFETITDSVEEKASPAGSENALQEQEKQSEGNLTNDEKEASEGPAESSQEQETLSEDEVMDFNKMTVQELKAFAAKEKIELGKAKTKAEIIEAITSQIDFEEAAEEYELPAYNPEAVLK